MSTHYGIHCNDCGQDFFAHNQGAYVVDEIYRYRRELAALSLIDLSGFDLSVYWVNNLDELLEFVKKHRGHIVQSVNEYGEKICLPYVIPALGVPAG